MTSDGKRSGSKYSPADQLINRRRNSNLIQLVSSCLLEAEADSAPKQAKSKPFLPSLAAPAASNLGNARMVGRHSAGAPPPPPLEVIGTARHPSRPLPDADLPPSHPGQQEDEAEAKQHADPSAMGLAADQTFSKELSIFPSVPHYLFRSRPSPQAREVHFRFIEIACPRPRVLASYRKCPPHHAFQTQPYPIRPRGGSTSLSPSDFGPRSDC